MSLVNNMVVGNVFQLWLLCEWHTVFNVTVNPRNEDIFNQLIRANRPDETCI